jgi:small subunit ribosomal protein S17
MTDEERQATASRQASSERDREDGAATRANSRKVREGVAVSVKMDKTVVVAVTDRVRHPRYRKTVQRTKRLYAHDETNDVREGDRVRVQETRPLSKQKRWRVTEVLERAR